MEIDQLSDLLEKDAVAASWLQQLRIADVPRGRENIRSLSRHAIAPDLLTFLLTQLERLLPISSDPDMALNNLERLFHTSRSPLSLAALFERDLRSLETLLRIFATSQALADQLINDPESFELLRITDGQPIARQMLVDDVVYEVKALQDEKAIMTALRRFKRRETLRIAYGDVIREQTISVVTRQISYLADALLEAAVAAAFRLMRPRYGQPTVKATGPGGRRPARFVVLALGKLGGVELNYSSDVDLIFVYDENGQTDGEKKITNGEFFDRLSQRVLKLLAESTELGAPYRVDMRLRPEGSRGPLVVSLESALHYYDVMGRTWERQAFVKARSVAGNHDLGEELLTQLEPWVYRRYLSRADITGIKALKRRIETRAERETTDDTNVKTGRGGIRDIEFVIQFLQLLNGGDLPGIRTGNTLEAIAALEGAGCLTQQERTILEENYAFLRKLEHRLQIMFDLQTHTMPSDEKELTKVALRMGYEHGEEQSALAAFQRDYAEKTALNRKILDHLLHDAFPGDDDMAPTVDLVLDPEPGDETIDEVLTAYGFHHPKNAYDNLMALTTEKVRFLSTRRCRHFLAAISSQLLEAISTTPDPDSTLINLAQVSDSLGGKGILWELFSANPATLNLYVRLCAGSPYLSGILISHPGMIDELMDSLMLDKLPTRETLDQILTELCRGAEDITPILHSFKNLMHLRVGVLDVLGKKDLQARLETLSDIAEICLKRIVEREYDHLSQRFGEPWLSDDRRCDMTIVGLGKLGGREPNYHSDLDLIFLYEAEGQTRPTNGKGRPGSATSNQHFFGQLAQRILKSVSELGPYGRLYETDARLRPTGKHGPLAVSYDEFYRYHVEGMGQLWERQALCKARPISGTTESCQNVEQLIRNVILAKPWQPEYALEIREMRRRMEETATNANLKRGPGGTVDIEFVVQMLQMSSVAEHPETWLPNTIDALHALHETGRLADDDFAHFHEAYIFLRIVEARLRLMNTTARHDLPKERLEVAKLAYLLGDMNGAQLLRECRKLARETRRRFERIFSEAAQLTPASSS
ncbi:bifunctional [glutamate--ammonia ligase]-adenylyl-L-tyrosine phosphorylase/[glutamate--ammonia-ligase] adenylyltransferase [Blastopirellula sp. J2-11]|uniref:bifunctional [glutamate--ammonia ligase]-adenylyl-L-tyrosine phosphorylase/[glutamate--ammonia-ligase] adenylyltransferase n=1 Tax=Blastopirellula sp. J2-11 TaxID=2943192 RepID=UPI0021C568E5|nr:bifunctional [glutamate--ammonia ligase]-adenylyl-L-tyrosine phosphorylase/[glutamate--ammonia-ligase] adenylyltransferase [Blastopirellula sp. J2-11]UUO06123.1 bifunctional [glutamate--ammonia ligase]-adenylyl-L-tyrosine phosphorylase/[glutamate--ammonia-ligase] adenylyltransferase [Blastopirellula sp. J2-11]